MASPFQLERYCGTEKWVRFKGQRVCQHLVHWVRPGGSRCSCKFCGSTRISPPAIGPSFYLSAQVSAQVLHAHLSSVQLALWRFVCASSQSKFLWPSSRRGFLRASALFTFLCAAISLQVVLFKLLRASFLILVHIDQADPQNVRARTAKTSSKTLNLDDADSPWRVARASEKIELLNPDHAGPRRGTSANCEE